MFKVKMLLVILFAITIYFILAGLSDSVFRKNGYKGIATYLFMALVWPLALFSPKGRRILLRQADKL